MKPVTEHIFNNNLKNVSDTDKYENPKTDAKVGPLEPLVFRCGVNGEYIVEGWNTSAPVFNEKTFVLIP